DLGAAVLLLLDLVLRAEDDLAAAGAVSLADAEAAAQGRTGGEVGGGQVLHQAAEVDVRVVEEADDRAGHRPPVHRQETRGPAPRWGLSTCRRADDGASSSRRRSPRTCWWNRRGSGPGRASPPGSAVATASGRRGRRAGPG